MFFHVFPDFFGIDFWMFFWRCFFRLFGENGSKTGADLVRRGEPFGDLFVTFSEDRLLDAFWSPVGSLLPPLGCLLAPFSLPLPPFCLPLAPFWLTLAIFWLPLAHPKATFPHFCCLLPSFLQFVEFSTKILCKICVFFENCHRKF